MRSRYSMPKEFLPLRLMRMQATMPLLKFSCLIFPFFFYSFSDYFFYMERSLLLSSCHNHPSCIFLPPLSAFFDKIKDPCRTFCYATQTLSKFLFWNFYATKGMCIFFIHIQQHEPENSFFNSTINSLFFIVLFSSKIFKYFYYITLQTVCLIRKYNTAL